MNRNKSIKDIRKMVKIKNLLKMLNRKVKMMKKSKVMMNKWRVILTMRKTWKMKLEKKMSNLKRMKFCREDNGMIKVKKK